MLIPGRHYNTEKYRFAFNGKESDPEWKGSTGTVYDYGFRIYNSRIGKFLSVDPLSPKYPFYTPYQFAGNKPIMASDLDGLEEKYEIRYSDYFIDKIQNSKDIKDKIFYAKLSMGVKSIMKGYEDKYIGTQTWDPSYTGIEIIGYRSNGNEIPLLINHWEWANSANFAKTEMASKEDHGFAPRNDQLNFRYRSFSGTINLGGGAISGDFTEITFEDNPFFEWGGGYILMSNVNNGITAEGGLGFSYSGGVGRIKTDDAFFHAPNIFKYGNTGSNTYGLGFLSFTDGYGQYNNATIDYFGENKGFSLSRGLLPISILIEKSNQTNILKSRSKANSADSAQMKYQMEHKDLYQITE